MAAKRATDRLSFTDLVQSGPVTPRGESGKAIAKKIRITPMADHKHGSMDTRGHEKTFAGFIRISTWGAVISIMVLIFMALTNA